MKREKNTKKRETNKKDVLGLKKGARPVTRKILFGATLISVTLAPYAVGICKGA